MYAIRDGESYRVRKLADGNVWMTENLRLISTSDITVKPIDSDVTSSFTLKASNSGTWCTDQTAECYNQSYALDSGRDDYGAYYNWYAATAGTGTYDTVSGNAPSSICPKGWRLPTGGSGGEFRVFSEKYNTVMLMLDAPNIVLSGRYHEDRYMDQPRRAFLWSCTPVNNISTFRLQVVNLEEDQHITPGTTGYDKSEGFSVRCVNK